MAATALPVDTITHVGINPGTPTAADAVNGNALATNNGVTTWVRATNTVAAAATVVVTTPNAVDGNAIADKTYNLPATIGAEVWFVVGAVGTYGAQPLLTASASTVHLAAYQL